MTTADSGGWLKALTAVSDILVKANRRSDAVSVLTQAIQGSQPHFDGWCGCVCLSTVVCFSQLWNSQSKPRSCQQAAREVAVQLCFLMQSMLILTLQSRQSRYGCGLGRFSLPVAC
jgi:hypothetical protein